MNRGAFFFFLFVVLASLFVSPIITIGESPRSILHAASWEDRWNRVLAEARREGKVVVIVAGESADTYRDVFENLSNRWGFKVEPRTLATRQGLTILLEECRSGRRTIDFILNGGMGEIFEAYPEGCLASIKDNLILPEVTDASKWRGGFLKFNDPDRKHILQLVDPVFGAVLYNPKRVTPKELRTVRDLLNPKFKGKLASFDPRRSGSGQSDAAHLLEEFGPTFMKDLYVGQEVVYTSNHRQLAEWIARGQYWVGLGPVDRAFVPLRNEGLPIGIMVFEDYPGYITGADGDMKLVKNAPHSNAAVAMMNWALSKEGQEVTMKALRYPVRRVDVKTSPDLVGEWRIPKDGVKYREDHDYQWYTVGRPRAVKLLTELLGR